jgi:tetratricopeptide (TPR) repeat protein
VEQPELVWAGCYTAIGNLAKAAECYKAALQNWPKDQDVRQRAVAFFRAVGRPDEAEAALRDALERDPKNTWIARELAQILSARRNDPGAWNEAMKLIGSAPADTDTAEDRLVRATVLARSPEPARRREAIPILEDLVTNSPGAAAAMAHELLARIYLDANQLEKASAHAQAIAARGTDPNAIAFCAEVMLRAKQFEDAARQVDRLAQIEPDSLRVANLRAVILQAQGKNKEAAAVLERRFTTLEQENSPEDEPQGRKIVDTLAAMGQTDAAERVGRRLADRRPRSAWEVALILGRRGQIDEALAYCRRAAAAGNAFEAGTTASILVSTQPLGDDAEEQLKQADAILGAAIKQRPDNFTLLFARAGIQRLQGRFQDALETYRTLLSKNPDNAAVLNNMAWTLSEDLDKPDEALVKIEIAIRQIERDPSLLDTRGVILTRLGKFDQAIKDLEAAVQMAPAASLRYHLARAYHKAGHEAECQKYRALAKQAGLAPNQLQPNEKAEMDALMNHH